MGSEKRKADKKKSKGMEGEIKKDALKLVEMRFLKSELRKKKNWILDFLKEVTYVTQIKYSQDDKYESKKKPQSLRNLSPSP